jgi:hypothetical protein
LADGVGVDEDVAVDAPVLGEAMGQRTAPADDEHRRVEEHTKHHARTHRRLRNDKTTKRTKERTKSETNITFEDDVSDHHHQ